MKNPIYVEYYSHNNNYCYKIDLPWPTYAKETIVLCKVSEGCEHAKAIALNVIIKHFFDVVASEGPKEKY